MIAQKINITKKKWQVICKPVCMITLESEPEQYLSLEINDLMVLLFNWGDKKTEVGDDGWNITELEAKNAQRYLDELELSQKNIFQSTGRDSLRINYKLSATPSEFDREILDDPENEESSKGIIKF